jgi:protein-disulfide isomerase
MKRFALLLGMLVPCLAGPVTGFDKDKVLGSPSAPVQIEIYSDFECPACKNFHENVLPLLMRDYVNSGKAYVVSREFPLNIPAHKYSREAANYATAAARIGKYQPVSDTLFFKQTDWSGTGKVWETIAAVLAPPDQKKVQALAKDPGVLSEVQRDVDSAQASRVSQTPTLMIRRGSKQYAFPGPSPENYMLLRSLIDGFLK